MATRSLDDIRGAIAGRSHAIEARFGLNEIRLTPMMQPKLKEDGTPDWSNQEPVLGGYVQFGAVKHGVFGRATPMGSMQMTIANPTAFASLKQAFEEHYMKHQKIPVFRVLMFLEEAGEEE